MSRKTISVAELQIVVNAMLAKSTCSADIRRGEMNVMEHVLHTTGNYRGFRYLLANEVPAGALPGVNYVEDDFGRLSPHPDIEKRFENTDNTRIYYYF